MHECTSCAQRSSSTLESQPSQVEERDAGRVAMQLGGQTRRRITPLSRETHPAYAAAVDKLTCDPTDPSHRGKHSPFVLFGLIPGKAFAERFGGWLGVWLAWGGLEVGGGRVGVLAARLMAG